MNAKDAFEIQTFVCDNRSNITKYVPFLYFSLNICSNTLYNSYNKHISSNCGVAETLRQLCDNIMNPLVANPENNGREIWSKQDIFRKTRHFTFDWQMDRPSVAHRLTDLTHTLVTPIVEPVRLSLMWLKLHRGVPIMARCAIRKSTIPREVPLFRTVLLLGTWE